MITRNIINICFYYYDSYQSLTKVSLHKDNAFYQERDKLAMDFATTLLSFNLNEAEYCLLLKEFEFHEEKEDHEVPELVDLLQAEERRIGDSYSSCPFPITPSFDAFMLLNPFGESFDKVYRRFILKELKIRMMEKRIGEQNHSHKLNKLDKLKLKENSIEKTAKRWNKSEVSIFRKIFRRKDPVNLIRLSWKE